MRPLNEARFVVCVCVCVCVCGVCVAVHTCVAPRYGLLVYSAPWTGSTSGSSSLSIETEIIDPWKARQGLPSSKAKRDKRAMEKTFHCGETIFHVSRGRLFALLLCSLAEFGFFFPLDCLVTVLFVSEFWDVTVHICTQCFIYTLSVKKCVNFLCNPS